MRERIDDRAFLRLIRTWLKAGMLETDGQRRASRDRLAPRRRPLTCPGTTCIGTMPWTVWCETVVKAHGRGEALLCRDADDWVCAFRYQDDAERFYRVLPKR